MHIRWIEITNLRSIGYLHWRLSTPSAGWHVILGDNGAGKTSFVQAVALALVGPDEAQALWEDWSQWLRRDEKMAEIGLFIRADDMDEWKGTGRHSDGMHEIRLTVERNEEGRVIIRGPKDKSRGPWRHAWSGYRGWFSAAFGPFRRFRGGDTQFDKLFVTHQRLARHLSAFNEGVALSEGLSWLQKLSVERLMDKNSASATLLALLQRFVNENNLLPQETQLVTVDPKKVEFRDGQGKLVEIGELSDGFRATLSMTFELIRQLSSMFSPGQIFPQGKVDHIPLSGVVLIDEIDAHLHPTWQHRIGGWLKKCFPRIQFIVTTHSPIICQQAEGGSIFKLPNPGSGETGRMLEGSELNRLLYGDVLDAYSTSAFNADVTRSSHAQNLINELGELNAKELDAGLDPDEQRRQRALRAILPGMDPKVSQ